MLNIGIKLHFQDNYDLSVAKGILNYAKTNKEWNICAHGLWFQDFKNIKLDGLIARIENEDEVKDCQTLNIPIVDIAGATEKKIFSTVRNDDYLTGLVCAEYLKDLGATNFAACIVEGAVWAKERLNGFISSINKEVKIFSRPLAWWQEIYSLDTLFLDDFLLQVKKPTAIFCTNDLIAMKVILQCNKLSLSVPNDITLLGVDNEELLCMLANPTLSSLKLQTEQIGFKASEMLDKLLREKTDSILIQRIPPLGIVERQSSNIVLEEDPYVASAMRIIKKNAQHNITCIDVANEVSICRRSLEQKFKKYRKKTILEEIVIQRLKIAESLLLNTNLKLEVIAEESGFGSIQRFFTCFKKYYNTTPNKYKESKKS